MSDDRETSERSVRSVNGVVRDDRRANSCECSLHVILSAPSLSAEEHQYRFVQRSVRRQQIYAAIRDLISLNRLHLCAVVETWHDSASSTSRLSMLVRYNFLFTNRHLRSPLFPCKPLAFYYSSPLTVWLDSYLTNRTQTSQLGTNQSGPHRVDCSVPRSSVLGPQEFTAYVEDRARLIRRHHWMVCLKTIITASGQDRTDSWEY